MEVRDLPALNATLNSISTMLLLFGYYFIKRKEVERHRLCMVLAFITSCIFLCSYLIYHYYAGSVPFQGQGWIRSVYFAILITHIVLAATVPVLALITLYRALKGDFKRHRAIAKWTWPIWMYVSVTGVIVYVMLYEM
jgi:putative membrane protein